MEALQHLFSGNLSLWGVFLSSFIAATLLPISSEIVLTGTVKLHPELFWSAMLLGTLGNTLGGLVSFGMGRAIPPGTQTIKHVEKVRHFGSPALLLAWVPFIGDALCFAAGWLRLNPWHAALFMASGKFSRYWVITTIS
jgi:membrane protein YqaA with SNARE-associated domain